MNNIKLTTMCMIYNDGGEILVQDRIKDDWPGITFPGGKVEKDEIIEESCIREIKEETGLDIKNLECMNYIEWNTIEENVRHLCILFRTKDYYGKLIDSSEGKNFFIKEKDIEKYNLSYDFLKIYKICKNEYKEEE
ncbi:NUDIX domain-containing protein [bacterium]|nr:NUDIX domain-containing protein [bacterium]